MRKTLASFALVALIASPIGSAQAVQPRTHHQHHDRAAGIKVCQYEDSLSCYWDARRQGNGRGASFYADARGCVYYRHNAARDWCFERNRETPLSQLRHVRPEYPRGWQKVPTRRALKMFGHKRCEWLMGDTTLVACNDGFTTTS